MFLLLSVFVMVCPSAPLWCCVGSGGCVALCFVRVELLEVPVIWLVVHKEKKERPRKRKEREQRNKGTNKQKAVFGYSVLFALSVCDSFLLVARSSSVLYRYGVSLQFLRKKTWC